MGKGLNEMTRDLYGMDYDKLTMFQQARVRSKVGSVVVSLCKSCKSVEYCPRTPKDKTIECELYSNNT
jgi:hypothetical protein